ncbi:MAG TPA: glycosyltransferase family 87 protein [Candidatus Limnocylindrales bacterium]|nr:glycosyltransferase family 87 protein [Candidatus Limnocylindrales bacterium]
MPETRRLAALMPLPALLGGTLAALVALGRVAWAVQTRGSGGLFNDFYDYWGAAALLNRGRAPYDITALAALQHDAGLQATTGSGYSYPLFFAELIRPLGLLPPRAAAIVFSGCSLIALIAAIALLLGTFPHLDWPTAAVGGVVAGLFPPVIGSLYFGQANLVVLLLLALAFRTVLPEPLLAIAGVIKLYPISGLVASLARRRVGWFAIGLTIFLGLLLLPQLFNPGNLSSRTGYFLSPDTYWSNASINGFLSRLAYPSAWTRPPLPGLPVEPLMIAIVAILALAATALVLTLRGSPWTGCLALMTWVGVVGAPKNSLWNFTPLLLCVAFAWPLARRTPWLIAAGAVGWLLIEAQAQLDAARETAYHAGPQLSWLSSVGLYGALLIGGVTAYLLIARRDPASSGTALRRPSP